MIYNARMDIGIDLVAIDDFAQSCERTLHLVQILFTDSELSHAKQNGKNSMSTLAGLFATKEALIKVGVIKPGEWLKASVIPDKSGKPVVFLDGVKLTSTKVSISHTIQYVIACVICQ